MIQLYEVKSCADYEDKVQVEGELDQEAFSMPYLELCFSELGFQVFSIGNPVALICKRQDCLFILHADRRFSVSEVESKEKLCQIIEEITIQIQEKVK